MTVNQGCCPPTCANCPGLGIPPALSVTFFNWGPLLEVPICAPDCEDPPDGDGCIKPCEGSAGTGGDVTGCGALNSTFYPTLVPTYHGDGGATLWQSCWYHQDLTTFYGRLNCADRGPSGDCTYYTEPCNPAATTSLDLWAVITHTYGTSQDLYVTVNIGHNAPDSPSQLLPAASSCVFGGFGGGRACVRDDPCHQSNEFCDDLINGVTCTSGPSSSWGVGCLYNNYWGPPNNVVYPYCVVKRYHGTEYEL